MGNGSSTSPAEEFAIRVAPRLACVRKVLRVCGPQAYGDPQALARAVPEYDLNESFSSTLTNCTWSIDFEMREYNVETAHLPFRACPGAPLALGFAAAMGKSKPE